MAKKAAPARHLRPRLSVEEVRAEIAKKFGEGVLIQGSDLKGRIIQRATSGCLAFDLALGGGWPLNTWNEIIGNPSSGKTSMILKTIAANQALDPNYQVLWVASEDFVVKFAEDAGVDMDRVEVVESNLMEEVYEIVIKYLDNRLVDCIVIDSFPALVPLSEESDAMEEWQVGLGARLTGKFFRKARAAEKRSLVEEDRACLLLIVNQWRMKIGVMFGDPRTTPGGEAKNYFFSIRVVTARDEWIEHDKIRYGIRMRMHTVKNKTFPVERAAGADFYFADLNGLRSGQYDEAKDLFSCGIYTEVIEKRGSTYEFAGQSWRGQDNVIASLREDLDLKELLRYEVLRSQGMDVDPPKATRRPVKKAAAKRATPPKKAPPKKAAAAPRKMVRRGTAT